jgi:hypothetical protein
MKNYWVQKDDWFYAWKFSIDPRSISVEALAGFAVAANAELEREKILEVETFIQGMNRYTYNRAEHGTMASYCSQLFSAKALIQLPCGYLRAGRGSVGSTIAYYDRNDVLVEQNVADLGILLRDLEPVPGAIFGYLRNRGNSPMEALGSVFSVDEIQSLSKVQFTLTTNSNIWSPYLYWTGHPWGSRPNVYYDNRELANRHTTRLNRVIGTLADMTAELGGKWELLDDGEFATARGIDLDPRLNGDIAHGAELTEWPDLFEKDYFVPMEERDYDLGR